MFDYLCSWSQNAGCLPRNAGVSPQLCGVSIGIHRCRVKLRGKGRVIESLRDRYQISQLQPNPNFGDLAGSTGIDMLLTSQLVGDLSFECQRPSRSASPELSSIPAQVHPSPCRLVSSHLVSSRLCCPLYPDDGQPLCMVSSISLNGPIVQTR